MISGKPVSVPTSMTGIPADASAARVPPVETISTPLATSAWAKSASPVLSETEIRARRSTTLSGGVLAIGETMVNVGPHAERSANP